MGKRLPMILDREDVGKLLDAPNDNCPSGLRNRAMLETMYRAGLRVSEVVKLGRKDVRFKEKILEIHNGKGDKDRTVPIDTLLMPWLKAWDGKKPKGKRFFCTLQGKPLMVRYIQAMVRRMAERSKIDKADKVSPHTLRHTYATELVEDGYNMAEVQALLGHSKNTNTMVYLHIRPKALIDKIQGRHADKDNDDDAVRLAKAIKNLPEDSRKALSKLLL